MNISLLENVISLPIHFSFIIELLRYNFLIASTEFMLQNQEFNLVFAKIILLSCLGLFREALQVFQLSHKTMMFWFMLGLLPSIVYPVRSALGKLLISCVFVIGITITGLVIDGLLDKRLVRIVAPPVAIFRARTTGSNRNYMNLDLKIWKLKPCLDPLTLIEAVIGV